MGSSGASGTQRDTSGTDRNESGTRGAADKARQLATDARSKATEATRERLTTQKSRAAESLGIVASSLRDSGNRLQERHEDGVSRMFTSAADQIERFSSTLENRDVGEMMREAERFARRQPAAFLGGAFVLGLVAARFFKASERNMEDDDRDRTRGLYGSTGTYDREAYRGAGERGYVGDREVPATPVVDSPPDDASSRSTTTGPSPELGR